VHSSSDVHAPYLTKMQVFDASDTTWFLHLQGAKTITGALSKREREMPCFEFILPWFDYHNVLSNYSFPANSFGHVHQVVNINLPEWNSENQKVSLVCFLHCFSYKRLLLTLYEIIGSLGCSTELLRLISCINELRSMKDCVHCDSFQVGEGLLELSLLIRGRLQHLNQEIHIKPGESMGTINHQRITLTAEFYRVATLLYLYEVAPSQAVPEKAVQPLVNEGFRLVEQMGICTSPWPLFIIACNVTSDIQRLKIFAILDTMNQKRRIGNYQIIKGLIQTLWKQQDLAANEKPSRKIDWRNLIDPDSFIPSFI